MGVTTVYRIGRGEANDIVVDDPSISREHAELRRKGRQEFTLVDLNSTNGTCVRAGSKWVEIESATVASDERILIGEVVTTPDSLIESCSCARDAGPSFLGIKLPAPAERTDFDLPTNDRAGRTRAGGDLERSAQRLTDNDVAQLVGPYRAGQQSAAPADEPFYTGHVTEPAFGPRRTSPDDTTEARVPAFASIPASMREEPDVDGASIVVDRRGSFRASPPRETWSPPRERRFAGAGKWAALALGSTFLVSAAAAGVVVYSTEQEDKASERHESVPAIFARAVTVKKRQVRRARVAAIPAIKPASLPPGLIGREERRAVVAMNKTGAKYWARTYGGAGQRRLMAIAPARGGGAFAAGSVKDPITGDHNAWIMRLDSYGNVIWQKKIGGAGDDHALALSGAAEGGVVVAGSAAGGRAIWIARYDKVGEQMWRRNVPTTKGGHATAVIRVGKSFVIGAIDRTGDGVASLLIRLEANGDVLWQRRIGQGYTWISAVTRARKGLLLVGVARASAGGPRNLWAMRTDDKGLKVWQRTYPRTEGMASSAFVQRARKRTFIIATTLEGSRGAASARVLRIKGDGAVAWDHVLQSNSPDRVAGMALQRGGVVLAGSTDAGGGRNRDLWVARLNIDGTLDWQRRYGSDSEDGAAALAQGRRGVLYVAGATTAAQGQGWVLKLNRRGELSGPKQALSR